jgi:segregation and condensation protein B
MGGRAKASILVAAEPVSREVFVRVAAKDCNLVLLFDDSREELRGRPHELVAVAGGRRHQTRKDFAEAIRAATGLADPIKPLSPAERRVADGGGVF